MKKPPERLMGNPSISLSRVTPPVLTKILPRPRLQELLERNEGKKLVLIIGQAAQGKSTVAAGYFHNNSFPSNWINVSPPDSDPSNFFRLMVQSVRVSHPQTDYLPLMDLPAQSLGPRERMYHYREWVGALFSKMPQPLQLFIDGLDHLHPEAEAFGLLKILIEETPPLMRLILLSRAYPPPTLDFQNLKMDRQALIINNEDLAFTVSEIREYFRELHGLSLTQNQCERVHEATEGWIGGVTLLADCLERIPETSIPQYLDQKLPDRFNRDAFQYFGREVFQALTPAQQDFLVSMALPDRLDPEIIRSFFPESGSMALLRELVRRNLFVQAYPDPAQGYTFRFHNLFKAFLLTQYQSRFSFEARRDWHVKLAGHYREKDDYPAAIGHYLQAQAYPEAAGLMGREGLRRLQAGNWIEYSEWLQKLPEEIVAGDPWLLLFRALPDRYYSLQKNRRIYEEAVRRFRQTGDAVGLLVGLAFLIEAEFLLGNYFPEMIQEADDLLEGYREDDRLFERAFLWTQIGMAQTLRGDPRRGYRACRNAYILSGRVGDSLQQFSGLCHAVYALTLLGEFREADRLLGQAETLAWRHNSAEILFFQGISKALYLTFKGETRNALEICDRLAGMIEKQGLAYLYPASLLHRQFALLYMQEYRQVQEIADRIAPLAEAVGNRHLAGIAEFYSGLAAYWADNPAAARQRLDHCRIIFESTPTFSEPHSFGVRIALGLLGNGDRERLLAIRGLLENIKYYEKLESHLFLAETRLALGLLSHDQGDGAAAKGHFQEGLDLARKRGYRHFLVISPRDTARACLLARYYLEDGDLSADYGIDLVTQKYGRLAVGVLDELAGHPDHRLSRTVQNVRRAVHHADKPILHITTFGGLRLTFNRKTLGVSAWDRLQPKRLLAAILSQSRETCPKEVYIEALWPEERPKTGENNFKTTLQRLRKTLEADIDPRFGSSYIHLHHNLLFFDEELCRIDCRKFAALAQEGKVREGADDWKGALDCYTRAADLYAGDFIPEERYAPWVDNRREYYRTVLVDLLTRSARLHDRAGGFKKTEACLKRVIEADPLLEEASRSLMALYEKNRRYNEALRVYQACRQALQAGLRTQPDPATRALAEGIRERQRKS